MENRKYNGISDIGGQVQKLGFISPTFIPANYSLSFDLTPLGISNQWSNIFHVTKTDNDGSRMPGVWVVPGTTKLHIRVGKEDQANDGVIGTFNLPMFETTRVVIELFGNRSLIYFNNSIAGYYSLLGSRDIGLATFLVSDPWYPAANFLLGNVTVSEIVKSKYTAVSGSLKGLIPSNTTATFDITPDGIVSKQVNNCGGANDLMTFYDSILNPISGSNGQFSIDYRGKLKSNSMLINGTTVKIEYYFPNGGNWTYYSYNMCDFLNTECPAYGDPNELQTFKIWERSEGVAILAGEWGTKIQFKMSALSKGGNPVFCITGSFDYTSTIAAGLTKRQLTKTLTGTTAYGTGYKTGICVSFPCRS